MAGNGWALLRSMCYTHVSGTGMPVAICAALSAWLWCQVPVWFHLTPYVAPASVAEQKDVVYN